MLLRPSSKYLFCFPGGDEDKIGGDSVTNRSKKDLVLVLPKLSMNCGKHLMERKIDLHSCIAGLVNQQHKQKGLVNLGLKIKIQYCV